MKRGGYGDYSRKHVGGAGGLFYELCQSARLGQSAYRFIFVPWFWQAEYRKTPPALFILAADEKELMARYGLNDAQIFWRRAKIAELGGVHCFRREYPSTPDEAFQADHPRALWSRDTLARNRMARADIPPLVRGVEAAMLKTVVRHKIHMLYRADVDIGMRLIGEDKIYTIEAVLDVANRKEYLEIQARSE